MKTLIFEKKEWMKLQEICVRGYPKEVCGLLFGRSGNGEESENRVVKVQLLENILNGRHPERMDELIRMNAISLNKERALSGGNYEFMIDPQEHYKKITEAERKGLDQIGLFHSHPDHPAVPSATDASQPFLAGWSNVIVAIHQGKFKEAQSWFREKENSAFQKEKILVE